VADSGKLIISGGGTGGHILAGIAIANQWRAVYGADAPILFVGAKGRIEEKLVPREGFALELLNLGSLNRVSVLRKIVTLIQLPVSIFKSIWILFRVKPSVTIGVGGYSSGPFVLMAALLGFLWNGKTAILEQNSFPGITNRILGRFVNFVFSSFDGMENFFSASKLRKTGNPIRQQFKQLDPATRDPFTIFIFGGSQGALGINSMLLEALPYLKEHLGRIKFIHQTGEKDLERVKNGYAKSDSNARIESFIDDMLSAYQSSSLVICRAGASSLAELSAVGRAAILIPLPTAADDHQKKNAQVYGDVGAAEVLDQSASGQELAELIQTMIEKPALIDSMEKRVQAFTKSDAASEIVRIVTEQPEKDT